MTNRKSHRPYRLSIGTDIDDLERRNNPYFAFSPPNSTDFQADYITVVEARPNYVRKILSPSLSSTLGQN